MHSDLIPSQACGLCLQRTRAAVVLAGLVLGLLAVPVRGQPADAASAVVAAPRLFAVEVRIGPRWDAARAPHEQAGFREHGAHLRRLREAGHIVLGARYGDKGLLVFSARSAAEVRALMDPDPSLAAGTFIYELHEFNVFYAGAVQTAPRRP